MKRINYLLAALTISTIFAACGTTEESGWRINGTIKGVANDSIRIIAYGFESIPQDYPIKDGKFTISSSETLSEPTYIRLATDAADDGNISLYIDKGTVTCEAEIVDEEQDQGDRTVKYKHLQHNSTVGGSDANRDYFEVKKITDSILSLPNLAKDEMEKKIVEAWEDYIKRNTSAFYSGVMIGQMSDGNAISIKKTKELLAALAPENNSSHVINLKRKVTENRDVDIAQAITASNVSYKVDDAFDGSAFKRAKYLGSLNNGSIVALNNDKTATIIDGNGKEIKSFAVSTTEVPSTMAVDKDNNLFVLVPEMREVERVFRGKTHKVKEIVGYTVDIFSSKGAKTKSFKLEGVKEATGARVADNKLIIADMRSANIAIFNTVTGAKEANIGGMRPCCGILDFDINDKNELLVANLGAFRVQAYDMSGKQQLAFGSRGNDLSAFHGCCNPVSVAYLSSGVLLQ